MIPSRSVVILQARVASARLPRKALARLGGRTLVGRCLDRLLADTRLPVVLATTTRPEDDALQAEADTRGVTTVRGPVDDVLARFVMAAEAMEAHAVVRATADNPAVDIEAPGRVLEMLAASGADYATESGLPYGAAVEACTTAALLRAHRVTNDAADREHVTLLFKRDRTNFLVAEAPGPARLCRRDLRLTVDTEADLRFMRRVLARAGALDHEPSLAAIIDAVDCVHAEVAA